MLSPVRRPKLRLLLCSPISTTPSMNAITHDTPPYPFMPSPISANSSDDCGAILQHGIIGSGSTATCSRLRCGRASGLVTKIARFTLLFGASLVVVGRREGKVAIAKIHQHSIRSTQNERHVVIILCALEFALCPGRVPMRSSI
jgi:hypothetical protein